MKEFILPHNDEVEKKLLGLMITEPDIIPDIVYEIKSYMFYEENNGLIFKALALLHSKGMNIDLVLLADQLSKMDSVIKIDNKEVVDKYKKLNLLEQVGGKVYLMELIEGIIGTENYNNYINIIKRDYKLRELKRTFDLSTYNISNGLGPEDIIKNLQSSIEKIENINDKQGVKSIGDLIANRIEDLGEQLELREPQKLVYSGFKTLDDYCGGFVENDLVVIGARSGMGKTSFVVNLIYNNILDNKKGIFFSLEMNENAIADKFIQLRSGIHGTKLRQWGRKLEELNKSGRKKELEELIKQREKDLETIYNTTNDLFESNLEIDCTPGITPDYIRKVLRREKMIGEIDFIVIDYLQIMKSGKRGLSPTEEVSELATQLKLISGEFSIPVIALSQLSRGLEQRAEKRPMMSDLRQSGKIEEASSFIFLLYRESYYDEFTDNKTTEVIIGKNRYGSRTTVPLHFDVGTGRLYEEINSDAAKEIFNT